MLVFPLLFLKEKVTKRIFLFVSFILHQRNVLLPLSPVKRRGERFLFRSPHP
jgi:hypothetical protein